MFSEELAQVEGRWWFYVGVPWSISSYESSSGAWVTGPGSPADQRKKHVFRMIHIKDSLLRIGKVMGPYS